MSRVGKAPIKVPAGVRVNVQGKTVRVEGPKGKMSMSLPKGVSVKVENDFAKVEVTEPDYKRARAYQGVSRTTLSNLVHGCHEGFTKEMDIVGVGYRAAVQGKTLVLTLGFSHPINFELPEGITAKVDKNTHLTLNGFDKVLLGRTAAKIRAFRPPEPYQGKGVRYTNERLIRKQGKAAGAK